ncbi:hypothetical protein ACN47E_009271 [Coniothyrium glycines]
MDVTEVPTAPSTPVIAPQDAQGFPTALVLSLSELERQELAREPRCGICGKLLRGDQLVGKSYLPLPKQAILEHVNACWKGGSPTVGDDTRNLTNTASSQDILETSGTSLADERPQEKEGAADITLQSSPLIPAAPRVPLTACLLCEQDISTLPARERCFHRLTCMHIHRLPACPICQTSINGKELADLLSHLSECQIGQTIPPPFKPQIESWTHHWSQRRENASRRLNNKTDKSKKKRRKSLVTYHIAAGHAWHLSLYKIHDSPLRQVTSIRSDDNTRDVEWYTESAALDTFALALKQHRIAITRIRGARGVAEIFTYVLRAQNAACTSLSNELDWDWRGEMAPKTRELQMPARRNLSSSEKRKDRVVSLRAKMLGNKGKEGASGGGGGDVVTGERGLGGAMDARPVAVFLGLEEEWRRENVSPADGIVAPVNALTPSGTAPVVVEEPHAHGVYFEDGTGVVPGEGQNVSGEAVRSAMESMTLQGSNDDGS